jgi:signal transduction histidine kinase/ActR/RegA family two-component response regulator
MTQLLAGDARQVCEMGLRTIGRNSRQLRVTATALAGQAPLILLAFLDVSERVAREEALASAQKALRQRDMRKDEFLAALSRELRNPLTPIRTSLYVLARTDPGSDRARRALQIIDRQVTHLARIVDDLLDVTRITRGKVQLQCAPVDFGELVRRSMDDHRTIFEASRTRMEGRFGPGPFWVHADQDRLMQVLSNLLGSAEKFARGGSVVLTLQREGAKVALRVRDTGAGIAPEMMEHLFEPFVQAEQTIDRTRGGLGLGLAMVKGLIELHGGTVGIASEGPGRGTELTVLLPLAAAPEQSEPAVERAPIPARRVLLIEDNRDVADSLADVLMLAGHEVQIAANGQEALALARTSLPEVVLCDLGLPGMDGYAVAKAFRGEKTLEGVYLVAISGYARPEDIRHALEAGFDLHVAKPIKLEQLDQVLADAPVAERNDSERPERLH